MREGGREGQLTHGYKKVSDISSVKLSPLQTQPPYTGSGVHVGFGAKVMSNI